MDHLPEVKLPNGPFIKVPYLSDRDYDGGLFEQYPQRRGWDLKRLVSRDFSEHPPTDTASFLQTWLFFGMLHEILEHSGGRMNESFVISDSNGKKWISTADLDIRAKEWAEHINSLVEKEGGVQASISKLASALTLLKTVSDILYGCDSCPLPEEVIFSLRILGSTIDTVFVWYWNIQRPVSWGLKDIAISRMIQQGWCPRDVALTKYVLSDIAMLYASYIKRDYQEQNHSFCSENLCAVNQIDEASYKTKHTTENCQCQDVEPDQDKIRSILNKGQIPVVALTPRVDLDGSKNLDIGIKSYAYMRWFVAVSHVWSDGLGNSHRNSLPKCQLQALYDLVVDRWWDEVFEGLGEGFEDLSSDPELSEKWKGRIDKIAKKIIPATQTVVDKIRDRRGRPISIWIDTLCVPLEKNYRKMAIATLKNVYSGAMFTIVLDSELQRTSCTCLAEENLMRIAISGWFRRAWTFQEGVLANVHLRVKFADGLVDLSKLLGQENTPYDIGPDFYLVQNEKVVHAYMSFSRRTDKIGGVQERQKRLEKTLEKRRNYSMSVYMSEEAARFFSYMFRVWMIPLQLDTNTETLKIDKARRIVASWMGLLWRETSRTEDKFIIFATACISNRGELDAVKGLLDFPPHGRMKLWLSQQFAVPAGFLFVPGRRYQEEGWGWAPKDVTKDEIEDDSPIGRTQKDTYLEITRPGFLLFLDLAVGGSSFVFEDSEKEQRCKISLDQTYLDTFEAENRPPLPPRPVANVAHSLPPRSQEISTASFNSALSVAAEQRPALPPRSQPGSVYTVTDSDSLTSNKTPTSVAIYSHSSISKPLSAGQFIPIATDPYDSTTPLANKSTPMSQRQLPKRCVPVGQIFALLLQKPVTLRGPHAEKTPGALIALRSQDSAAILGLFICSVTVEVIGTEMVDVFHGPHSSVVQRLSESQIWKVG